LVFSSLIFLFFFLPVTLIAYYLWPNRTWRNILLLAVSLFFYAWGEPVYVLLMMASIVVNWVVARIISSRDRLGFWVLAGGVTFNIIGIGVFKYSAFVVESFNTLSGLNMSVPNIALPIGISFYTFQAISYLVDVHRGMVMPQKNPLFFGTYLVMFPQLIAGPIVRYETIEREILERRESSADFVTGFRRFCIGLGKKVLIADTMGAVADTLLATEPTIGAIPAWTAFIAYSFQIYFDFSGYSDMAIGLGKMFGFHFLENFNHPYVARSVKEFWRRWNISLSTFFRDYVYIPLGGSRLSRERWVFNLLVVWSLTGLWHGAQWNFVCWGAYYGILLIGERIVWGRALERLPNMLQHLYMILIILFGWVIFRIEDFSMMGQWFSALFGRYGAGHPSMLNILNVLHYWPWFLVAAIGSTPIMRLFLMWCNNFSRGSYALDFLALAVFVWSSLTLATGGYNPFIYFRF